MSILVPALNEEPLVERCLETILAFDLPPGLSTEVIVLDGGSTDRTREIVALVARRDDRVRLVENPRRIQSSALNLGLSLARGEHVMRLDAHSLYPRDYLLKCVETARRTSAHNVGGIAVNATEPQSYSEAVVKAVTTHPFGVGGAAYRGRQWEGPSDTVPYGFFPKSVFERFGMYDERLERAQDYEFNRRIIARGGRIWLNPAIRVFYHSHISFGAFLRKQVNREGPFNAYMWYIAPYAFAVRHAATLVFVTGLASLGMLAAFVPAARWLVAGLLLVYGVAALMSAIAQARRYREPRHIVVLPFAFLLFHVGHGCGVLGGILRLATHSSPVQGKKAAARPARTVQAWEA